MTAWAHDRKGTPRNFKICRRTLESFECRFSQRSACQRLPLPLPLLRVACNGTCLLEFVLSLPLAVPVFTAVCLFVGLFAVRFFGVCSLLVAACSLFSVLRICRGSMTALSIFCIRKHYEIMSLFLLCGGTKYFLRA